MGRRQIAASQISGRALQVAVPGGPIAAAQAAALRAAMTYGQSVGVAVSFVPF